MPYSLLFRRALNVIRRDPALLVLGFILALLGGGSGGGGGGNLNFSFASGGDGNGGQMPSPDLLGQVDPLMVIAIVSIIFIVIIALILLFTFLQSVAQSGLVYGVDEVDRGTDVHWKELWRVGFSARGRQLFRLRLMLIFAVFAVVLAILVPIFVFATITGAAISSGAEPGVFAGLSIATLLVLVIPFSMLVVAVSWVLGLVVNLAVRDVVLNGTGTIESIKAGWRLFRDNVVATVVTSLGLLLLSLLWVVPVFAVVVVAVVSVALIVFGLGATTGGFTPLIVGLIVIGGLGAWLLLAAVISPLVTYAETVWTLLWRHLRGDRPLENELISA
ncbi:MAG: hypothetical protein H6637_05015 [Ardenticatenales bacterium]|nr:hypothetical protein [Ardenticatenales bacterium]